MSGWAVVATIVVGLLSMTGAVWAALIALRSAKESKAVERAIARDSNATENRKVDLSALLGTVEALQEDVTRLRARLGEAEANVEVERQRTVDERALRRVAEAEALEAKELASIATREARECAERAAQSAESNQAELARFREAAKRHGWLVDEREPFPGDDTPDLG